MLGGRVVEVVVGGVATVLHGHARLTADIDLVIDLAPDEARKAVETLTRLGFRARAPVEPLAFTDAAIRRDWVEQKGMRVFSLWDPSNPMLEVDLFAEHPIDFEELWERAEIVKLAGRPQDLADIEALELILRRREGQMPGDELHDKRDDEWGVGWKAHRVHQLTLALHATPAQRLAWLEEAIALAYRVGALPKPRA